MLAACKRFRASFSTWPKIDLANPAPSLAPLALAVAQAQTLMKRAQRVATLGSSAGDFRLAMAVGGAEVEAQGTAYADAAPRLSTTEVQALATLHSLELSNQVCTAEKCLEDANAADTAGSWRQVVVSQHESQESLNSAAV